MMELLITPVVFSLVVAFEYPIFRDQLNRSLSGVDADTAEAIRHSMRSPIKRIYWAWIGASAACAAIVTTQVWSSDLFSSFWFLVICVICVVLWSIRSSVLNQLNKELEDRGIPSTARPLESTRLATLRPRTVASYLPPVMFVLPWAFLVLSAAYLAVKAFQNPPTELPMWMWSIGGILGACFMILIGTQLISGIISHSHPAGSSVSRMKKLELLRSLQIYCAYIMMFLVVAMMLQSSRIGVESGKDTIPYESLAEYGGSAASLGMTASLFGVALSIIILVQMVLAGRKQ